LRILAHDSGDYSRLEPRKLNTTSRIEALSSQENAKKVVDGTRRMGHQVGDTTATGKATTLFIRIQRKQIKHGVFCIGHHEINHQYTEQMPQRQNLYHLLG
jgi:hypothetical protein